MVVLRRRLRRRPRPVGPVPVLTVALLAHCAPSVRGWVATSRASAPAVARRRRTLAAASGEMELWLDLRGAGAEASLLAPSPVDAVLVDEGDDPAPVASATRYAVRTEPDGPPRLFRPGDATPSGALVDVSAPSGQDAALGLIGSVEWIVLAAREDLEEGWLMIPAENLIASCRGTGTRIAAVVERAGDVGGLARALELGVDALCVGAARAAEDDGLWGAAIAAREERRAAAAAARADGAPGEDGDAAAGPGGPTVVRGTCRRVASAGGKSTVLADRVCIDLVQSLAPTEGCWLGSSAKIMALVLSEAAQSSFVPSRPFRVNAGPVHSYVVLGDGVATKYLSELRAGDEVLVHDAATGRARPVAVGRLKVEVRPCVQVGLVAPAAPPAEARRGQVFLQQAETVRLGRTPGEEACLRITDLDCEEGAAASDVMLRVVDWGTHVGKAYSGKVDER